MGRQVAIDLSDQDEVEFLSFLRQSADIQIIRGFAKSPESLFVEKFEPRGAGNWDYALWNKAFPWQPTFAQTKLDLPELERRGLYYVANKSTAPLLEYSRQARGPNAAYGRVYWAKDFSAPSGLEYDVEAFASWYESVARWLRSRSATRSNKSLERTRGR
jgi:hypothetical protein